MTDATGPGVVVSSNSGIEFSKHVQVFCGGDISDGCLKLLVKLVLYLSCGTECGSITAQDVNWA